MSEQRPIHPFGLSFHVKGRMSDVLPCLCERWCSLSWLMEITGCKRGEIRAEIDAIRKLYFVDELVDVERGVRDRNMMDAASTGRIGVFFRVTGRRDVEDVEAESEPEQVQPEASPQ